MVASAWRDNKMGTNVQPTSTGSVQRKQHDGTAISVTFPESIILYKFMGDVNRGDQLLGYYRCRVKSWKFYKYIYFFPLDASTNSFVLYKTRRQEQHMKCKQFILELASLLIGDYCNQRWPGHVSQQVGSVGLRHFPVRILSPSSKRGKCAHCIKARHTRTDNMVLQGVPVLVVSYRIWWQWLLLSLAQVTLLWIIITHILLTCTSFGIKQILCTFHTATRGLTCLVYWSPTVKKHYDKDTHKSQPPTIIYFPI